MGGSAVVTVALIVVATVWLSLNAALAGITRVPNADIFPQESTRPASVGDVTGTDTQAASPVNILVLGTDSRAGAGDPDDLNSGDATGQRSDTMMLVHISADRRSVATISIMRDSWVSIPGHGDAKINAAMSFGGTPLAVQTVEQLLGVRIDHVAVVDFEAFKAITDRLGGITVDSPVAFRSQNVKGFEFVAGANDLTGDAALAFVRERYAFGDGDYQRVKNQRAVVRAVADRLFATAGQFDLTSLTDAAAAAAPYIVTDEGFDLPTIISLGASLTQLTRDEVVGFTLPSTGTGTSADGQSIVVVDDAQLARIRSALADDSVVTVARELGLTD